MPLTHCLLSISTSRTVALLLAFLVLFMNRAATTTAAAMTTTTSKGALIFLHGLGDSPAGWSQLKSMLPSMKPRLKDITYIFPAAPTIGITINGGMEMPGWFGTSDAMQPSLDRRALSPSRFTNSSSFFRSL